MSELQKPAALQFRHSNSDGFVAAYEKEEMDKYLSEVVELISTIRAERDEYRYNLSCARNEIHNLSTSMREDVKRLADKDKEIADLKADYKEACDRLQTANLIKDEQMAKVAKQSEVISSLKWEIGNLERRVYAANRDARRTRY